MPRYTNPVDNAMLFYRDYKPLTPSTKPALLFMHGWPYSSLMYEQLLIPLCLEHGFRCIAPDRRGFGKSDWDGPSTSEITFQTFADDTCHLLEAISPGPFVVIASSMGPGESVLAYRSTQYFRDHCKVCAEPCVRRMCNERFLTFRIQQGFIWLAPSLPGRLSSPNFPAEDVWNEILGGFVISRGDFTHTALPGALVGGNNDLLSAETLARYDYIVGEADPLAIQRCLRAFLDIDFGQMLRELGEGSAVPMLCIHGTNDTGSPYEATTKIVKELIPRMEVKLYEGAAHG